jgi:8-oxo-dGTP diphosphatase
MRHWTVGGGLIEHEGRLLLVQNSRRDGTTDWSTPGGVIDEGETVLEGLTREVAEETGLTVSAWEGPVWEVEASAPDMGWTLKVEVHRAVAFEGELTIDDPDGIVIDADWHDLAACHSALAASWVPAREPMLAWLASRWVDPRQFRYEIVGADRATMTVTRVD